MVNPSMGARWRGLVLAALVSSPTQGWSADVPAFQEIRASAQHLSDIRHGGYALYIRHGLTDNSRPDQVPVDLADCATQRPLSDDGRRMARRVGERLAKARVPIGEIHASVMCRAQETAREIFPGKPVAIEENLRYLANLTADEKRPIIDKTRSLLATQPKDGQNDVVVAHAPNLMEIIGYFPVEGTVVIFRPSGDGNFTYLASIPPAHWDSLQP